MKIKTNNKVIRATFCLASFVLIFSFAISTAIHPYAMPSEKSYNWYFKKTDDHSQPPTPSDLSFIDKYSCKWIDRKASGDKVIYLTFDAGYENGNVAKILDAMKAEGATGTFFILENLVLRNPELVTRMHEEGHTIGNHTMKHPDLTKIDDKAIFSKQVTGLEKCCMEKLGIEISKYFRPPQGKFSERVLDYLEALGEKSVFWSFAYADWDNSHQPDPQKSIDNILAHTHNGMVILLHPTSSTNAEIMPELLKAWKAQGYRFGSMDELFGA